MRVAPVDYDGLRGITDTMGLQAYWLGRDTAHEANLTICSDRGDRLVGVIADANRHLAAIADETRPRIPWWRPWDR